ncbi:MAG: hypothetical protein V4645_09950 [Pseudomonadota bacterium]
MHNDDKRTPPGSGNVKEVNDRMVALFGGTDQLYKHLISRLEAFTAVWDRDSLQIGQTLHAHIVVEHFLDRYLRVAHPEIDFENWQLNFDRKVSLIPKSHARLQSMAPGLRALGRIRNKLAHRLHFQISKSDVLPMISVAEYKTMRTSTATQAPMDFKTATPEVVVLDFAKWMASTLQLMADPDQVKVDLVFDLSRNIDGTPAQPRVHDGGLGSVGTKRPLFGDS